jgi:hypothetical protein
MGSGQGLTHFSLSVLRALQFPPQRLFQFLNRRGAGGLLQIRFLSPPGYVPVGLPQQWQQPVNINESIVPYPGTGSYQTLGPGLDFYATSIFPEQTVALPEKAAIFLGPSQKGWIGLENCTVENISATCRRSFYKIDFLGGEEDRSQMTEKTPGGT